MGKKRLHGYPDWGYNINYVNKNEQLSTVTTGTPYEDDLRNQYNYLEEFYRRDKSSSSRLRT